MFITSITHERQHYWSKKQVSSCKQLNVLTGSNFNYFIHQDKDTVKTVNYSVTPRFFAMI